MTLSDCRGILARFLRNYVFVGQIKPRSIIRTGDAATSWRVVHVPRRRPARRWRVRRMVVRSLDTLMCALEARDPCTREHSSRVAQIASLLVDQLRPGDPTFAARVRLAALFHDIGKLGVADAVLNKKGALTEEEMDEMRRHPEVGANILRHLLDEETVAMVRSHHEQIDGSGYPDRLRGDAIPLGGRIIAVADAYDAMTSPRPYRMRMDLTDVLAALRAGAGQQWDATAVSALLRIAEAGRLPALIEKAGGDVTVDAITDAALLVAA